MKNMKVLFGVCLVVLILDCNVQAHPHRSIEDTEEDSSSSESDPSISPVVPPVHAAHDRESSNVREMTSPEMTSHEKSHENDSEDEDKNTSASVTSQDSEPNSMTNTSQPLVPTLALQQEQALNDMGTTQPQEFKSNNENSVKQRDYTNNDTTLKDLTSKLSRLVPLLKAALVGNVSNNIQEHTLKNISTSRLQQHSHNNTDIVVDLESLPDINTTTDTSNTASRMNESLDSEDEASRGLRISPNNGDVSAKDVMSVEGERECVTCVAVVTTVFSAAGWIRALIGRG